MAAPRKPRRTARRTKREAAARGNIAAGEATVDEATARALDDLAARLRGDGATVLAEYREPLAGKPVVLAMLPLDRVDRTVYQRDVSPTHAERLADAIAATGLYLDPIVAFRDDAAAGDGRYHTPNGGHRLAAMHKIGARAITALVVPDEKIAFRILALNTEKAHNLRERALEVMRMARGLVETGARESEFAMYFEEPALLTLGAAYEKRGRFAGSVWHPLVRRIDAFLDEELADAVATRERRAEALLALDDAVAEKVEALKAHGFESPYLKAFVVARIDPLRFVRGKKDGGAVKAPSWDETVEKVRRNLDKFTVDKIKPGDVARSGGPPVEAEA